MFRFSQKLAAVAAGSLLAAVAVHGPAQAVTSFSFEVDLSEPVDGADTFLGSFSFEEGFGTVEDGVEFFDLVAFDFDFLGSSFDLSSDSRVASLGAGFPSVSFDEATGDILGLDFFTEPFLSVPSFSFAPADLVGDGADDIQSSEFVFTSAGISGDGDVDFKPVPEPATLIGLAAIAMGTLLVRKPQV